MPSIAELQQEIVEEFDLFDNWDDKYAYLIELGKKLPPLDTQWKTEQYIIKGCQSQVWLYPSMREQRLWFEGDSDALIVRGLVSLLIRVLSGQPPADIAAAELAFMERIGLQQHLSMTRANGLMAMVKQMKLYAFAAQSSLGSLH